MSIRQESNCQSCSMPLTKDKNGGGTNADGSCSREYCSHCYMNGAFTEPLLTADEMKEKVKGRFTEMHFPGFVASLFTRNIPNLKRWKSQ